MQNNNVKRLIDPLLEKAQEDHDVIAVMLFGSAASKKIYRDIDIALVLDPKMTGISMSRKRLKYLENFPDLDVQIFNTMPLYIRKRVLVEGKVLLENDTDALYDIAYDTVKEYEDFRPFYEGYMEAVAND